MWKDVQALNEEVWEGHSHTFEDVTHLLGGVGLGMLLCTALRERRRLTGFALVLLSALLHLYAYIAKPVSISTD
jgi:hypothetical protein